MGSCLGRHPQVGAPILCIFNFSLIKRIGRWYGQLLMLDSHCHVYGRVCPRISENGATRLVLRKSHVVPPE